MSRLEEVGRELFLRTGGSAGSTGSVIEAARAAFDLGIDPETVTVDALVAIFSTCPPVMFGAVRINVPDGWEPICDGYIQAWTEQMAERLP